MEEKTKTRTKTKKYFRPKEGKKVLKPKAKDSYSERSEEQGSRALTKGSYYQAVGRRKCSSAVVRLFKQGGPLLVNDKPIEEYFPGEPAKVAYSEPFRATGTERKFSGTVKVSGGGKTGQLGAVVLGFARALISYDEKFRPSLSRAGLLTRDSREKEPKKYFLRKARKRPQYSKR